MDNGRIRGMFGLNGSKKLIGRCNVGFRCRDVNMPLIEKKCQPHIATCGLRHRDVNIKIPKDGNPHIAMSSRDVATSLAAQSLFQPFSWKK